LLPSPAAAFRAAYDFSYRTSSGATGFWLSVGIIGFVTVAAFVTAAVALPRLWQDAKPTRKEEENTGTLREARVAPSSHRRWHLPDPDPCFWLASRDRFGTRGGRLAMLLLLCVWGIFFVLAIARPGREGFIICLFSAYAVHQLAKYLMMVEATRQMSADRQSGALELLLVTPLRSDAIIKGYARAFRQQFVPLIGILVLLNASMCILTLSSPFLSMSPSDRAIFFELFLGGAVVLVLDFRTIGKIGFLRAIHSKNHNRAILSTLMRVMLPPWGAIILMVFAMQAMVRSANSAAVVFAFWFGLGIVNDFLFDGSANLELRKGLRRIICAPPAGSSTGARDLPTPALSPAKA